MKNQYKNIILILICIVLSICVLAVSKVTGDKLVLRREENNIKREVSEVLPDVNKISSLEIGENIPQSVKEIYLSDNGVAVRVTVVGYAPGLELLCGIKNGKVTKIKCVSSRETLGAEKDYGTNFEDKTLKQAKLVSTVSGATKTTSAYKQGVIDALEVYGKVAEE